MAEQPKRKFMDVKQAAEYLKTSPSNLYVLVRNGIVPAFMLGKRWRFNTDELDRLGTGMVASHASNQGEAGSPNGARIQAGDAREG